MNQTYVDHEAIIALPFIGYQKWLIFVKLPSDDMQVIGVSPQHLISVAEHNSLLGHLHKIGHMQDSYNICGHFCIHVG